MALPVRDQAKYWGVAIAVFLVTLYALGNVILPFVLGGVIAYMLDPIADRLEKLGLTRVLSVAAITVVGLIMFLILVLLVIPTLIQQSIALAEAAPALIDSLQATLTERFPQLLDADSTIRPQLDALGTKIQSQGGAVINGRLTSAMGLINIIVLLVVVPVVAFYLLLDWNNMVAKIDDMLPRDHAPTVRQLASQVDNTLASFIRGQGTVCLA
jgi:predicted PurR-regulated permease PerM